MSATFCRHHSSNTPRRSCGRATKIPIYERRQSATKQPRDTAALHVRLPPLRGEATLRARLSTVRLPTAYFHAPFSGALRRGTGTPMSNDNQQEKAQETPQESFEAFCNRVGIKLHRGEKGGVEFSPFYGGIFYTRSRRKLHRKTQQQEELTAARRATRPPPSRRATPEAHSPVLVRI